MTSILASLLPGSMCNATLAFPGELKVYWMAGSPGALWVAQRRWGWIETALAAKMSRRTEQEALPCTVSVKHCPVLGVC